MNTLEILDIFGVEIYYHQKCDKQPDNFLSRVRSVFILISEKSFKANGLNLLKGVLFARESAYGVESLFAKSRLLSESEEDGSRIKNLRN